MPEQIALGNLTVMGSISNSGARRVRILSKVFFFPASAFFFLSHLLPYWPRTELGACAWARLVGWACRDLDVGIMPGRQALLL